MLGNHAICKVHATDGGAAAVRKHRRERRPSVARVLAMAMLVSLSSAMLLTSFALADTGLGEYLNNPSGATSVAYEYLTGDDWDDISHEGNSEPATYLSGPWYTKFRDFVDTVYHDTINPISWYSTLEGLAFLNSCTAARKDIAQCLKDHPLNNGDSGSGGNDTSGSVNGGIDVNMIMYGGTQVTDKYGTVYNSTGYDAALQYKSDYVIKLPIQAKNFVSKYSNRYIFVTLQLLSGIDSQTGTTYTFWRCIIDAFDPDVWGLDVTRQDFNVNQSIKSIPSLFVYRTKDDTTQTYANMILDSGKRDAEHRAPWEVTYTSNITPDHNLYAAYVSFSKDGNYNSFNYTLAIGDDYVPPVSEPTTPTPPDPDEPGDMPSNVILAPTVFDTTDIVEAIETLDTDMIAAFNNLSGYLKDLFDTLDDNLQGYIYNLDVDLVQSVKWLRQELVDSIEGVGTLIDDCYGDVSSKLDKIDDDINNALYRLELQLTNIYNRMGLILSKLGNGGDTVTRPDPADDNDGFLDWLWQLFETGLEDLLETLNLTGLVNKFAQLTSKFPFSIPWDIAYFLALFIHEPVTPVFVLPMPHFSIDGSYYTEMQIDCTQWEIVGQASRDGTFILFAVGLALRTKELLSNERLD